MTREEFLDGIYNLGRLYDFCTDNDLYEYLEDLYTEESYNQYINEDLSDNSDSWQDVRDWLYNLPDGYDFYYKNDWGEWIGIDGDNDGDFFEDLKRDVYDACCDNDFFDEEDNNEQANNDSEEEVEEVVELEEPEEDFNFDDVQLDSIFSSCSSEVEEVNKAIAERQNAIIEKQNAAAKELEQIFALNASHDWIF